MIFITSNQGIITWELNAEIINQEKVQLFQSGINELSHVQIPVMLMPDDFKAYSKIKVDNHLFNNAPLPNDSQARSGARFHTSYDKRYIIKTITSEDVAEMHNILKKYHQYIVECHGITLLPQFLGMYRLNVDGVEIYVIVTRNVFSHRLSVYRKYDLKAKELPTLKDNDFINEGQKIYIDDNNKKVFLEKLKKDVEFLAQLKLMDYSLLVGIHDVERAEQEEVECEEDGEEEGESDGAHPVGTPPDSPGNTLNSSPPLAPGEFDPNIDVYGIKCHENSPRKEVYFMAIIDILTHYDAKKKAAHAAKTVKHGIRSISFHTVDCIFFYYRRFLSARSKFSDTSPLLLLSLPGILTVSGIW
ncbi:hypothetical protein FD755_004891 [Muntiacus reevesi]|uniref:Phosphatidylinositol 5-phosphate 4-kinase type-2 alpha n=2 Tax=Muntiacus TaxID=9885 RepID=A0A5J5MRY9_MUNRE|nr:hypothetical protein FD754_017815 [Muntiacus muntjak]KAB0382974.1 hypothetical protein FD755_004891 [Muntiacus reevesi]